MSQRKKTIKEDGLNEVTQMGEVLVSLGECLESAGGSMSLGLLGLSNDCDEGCAMDLADFLEHMARNSIRFCIKEER
jgi:hypothetical protein